ncbi:MAG: phage tail protein [Candidatus Electrothrix sp. MAN1_4]|nr:phage tail protein [Candidatus Electrothrix sp. MAN1_4]
MTEYYPPWGFYYKVVFDIGKEEVRFQNVSGLSVEYDMEKYKEGGENRFVHKLPVRTKYADLVLKRGMLTDSQVIRWFLNAFRDREFKPTNISVMLLNEQANKQEKPEPLRTWNVVNAVPKKWLVSDFNATENSVVIETLELTYNYFTIQEKSR